MRKFFALTVEAVDNGISTTEKFCGKDMELFHLNDEWYCFHRYNKVFNSVVSTEGLTIDPEGIYYITLENYKGILHEVPVSKLLCSTNTSDNVSTEVVNAETKVSIANNNVIDVEFAPTLSDIAVKKDYRDKKPLINPFNAVKNGITKGLNGLRGKIRGKGDSACHIVSEITNPLDIAGISWNSRYNKNGYYVGVQRTVTFNKNNYTIVLKVESGISTRIYKTNMTFRSLDELNKKFPYTFKEYNSYGNGRILNVVISEDYKNSICIDDRCGNRTTITENALQKMLEKFD